MVKHSTLFIVIVALIMTWLPMKAQVNLNTLNGTYSQDFNSLASAGTANDVSTLPQGWTFLETGTNANTTYAAGTGSSNAGNTYSLGVDADRSLGGLRSGSLIPVLGASFANNTGALITSLQIVYNGEQWRLGASPRTTADKLDFQYSLNATSLASGAWTDVDALDFNAPVLSGTVGALIGNTNKATPTFTITGLAIAPGSVFWIRWNDFDVSGADDALGVDDFSITPDGIPGNQPNLSFTPSSLNFGTVNTGSNKVLTYSFDGSNLDNAQTLVTEFNPSFALSLDGINFSDSLTVGDSTLIYVRFTPQGDGAISDSINHINGSFHKQLSITGTGYNPVAHIIPISTARVQPVGTRVTVAGRVTVSNQFASPAYVQDGTGGIPVFDSNVANNVTIGDSIVVTGSISLFSAQVEISGAGVSFFKADSTSRIVSPKNIQIGDLAANEGLLVTVQNVQLVNKAFVFYPQSTEEITDGSIQADLRIDGDTDIAGLAKPQDSVNITGVVGRFQTNAQLMPRSKDDIPGAVPPVTVGDSIPHTATFDLMNWNLEFFGAQSEDYGQEFGPVDEPLQMNNVAKVILNQDPDVVAVQEVSNDNFFAQLIQQFPGYSSICSPRWSFSFNGPDNTFPPQKVCYIYDTTTVKIISHRAMFEQLYDQARLSDPSLLPGIPGGDTESFFSSGRLPFLLTADVTINGVTERINFINIHAKSGGDDDARVRRAYDAQVLKDSLDAFHNTEKFVVLGDLNDDVDQSIVIGQPSPYADIVADTAYVAITKALSDAGAKSTVSFDDVIDHQILSTELDQFYINGSVRIFAPFELIPNYGTTTSDHLPVLSRFEFPQPVPPMPTISFASTELSFAEGSGKHEIALKLTKALAAPGSVTISASNSHGLFYGVLLDYITEPGLNAKDKLTLKIPANKTEVSFEFHPNKDLFKEEEETVTFTIASVSSDLNIGSPSSLPVHIVDVAPCLPIFLVYPNPTNGPINIWTPEYNEDAIVHGILYDPNGNSLTSLDGTVAQLGEAFTHAFHGKRIGIYTIKLIQCDQVFTYRVVKW
jgi:endonuclease/exonuclease/phosphatase family metal-dependent hydrolase